MTITAKVRTPAVTRHKSSWNGWINWSMLDEAVTRGNKNRYLKQEKGSLLRESYAVLPSVFYYYKNNEQPVYILYTCVRPSYIDKLFKRTSNWTHLRSVTGIVYSTLSISLSVTTKGDKTISARPEESSSMALLKRPEFGSRRAGL